MCIYKYNYIYIYSRKLTIDVQTHHESRSCSEQFPNGLSASFCSSGLPCSASGTWPFAMRWGAACFWDLVENQMISKRVYNSVSFWWFMIIEYVLTILMYLIMLMSILCWSPLILIYPDAFKKSRNIQESHGITIRSYEDNYIKEPAMVANSAGPAQFQWSIF